MKMTSCETAGLQARQVGESGGAAAPTACLSDDIKPRKITGCKSLGMRSLGEER